MLLCSAVALSCSEAGGQFESVSDAFSAVTVNNEAATFQDGYADDEGRAAVEIEFGGTPICSIGSDAVELCREVKGSWQAWLYWSDGSLERFEGQLTFSDTEFLGSLLIERRSLQTVECGLLVHSYSIEGDPKPLTGFGADSIEVVPDTSVQHSACDISALAEFDTSAMNLAAANARECTAWLIARGAERVTEFGLSRCEAPAAFVLLDISGRSREHSEHMYQMPSFAQEGIHASTIEIGEGCWLAYTLTPDHDFGPSAPTLIPTESTVVTVGDEPCGT